jgi:hypothetical protein
MPDLSPAARLAVSAEQAARGILSATVARAARSAVDAVAAQTEAGYLTESAHDVAALRRDAGLVARLGEVRLAAVALVLERVVAALEDGFRRTAEADGPRLGLVVELTPGDLAALRGHPVVGATPSEWADDLAGRLAWRVRSIATRAALNAIQPGAIPSELDHAAAGWATEVGRLVRDAWGAGTSAATAAMARALSGG